MPRGMLATLGAEVTLLEPPGGTPLRREPPFLPGSETPRLFAYLAAGADSWTCDLATGDGRAALGARLSEADILIDDTPLAERAALGLDEAGNRRAPSRPDPRLGPAVRRLRPQGAAGRARRSTCSTPRARAICCPTA